MADVPGVADLVVQMHSNIDSIHQCVQTLSDTASHDAEMERLEREREEKIAEIRAKHENDLKELASQREKEQRELEEQRKREEEELIERRRREDEERQARFKKEEDDRRRAKEEEDQKRRAEMEGRQRSLSDAAELELERLEDEMERKVEEGKMKLQELDEKRRAINAQIEAALNKPTVIPTIMFRSRRKTLGKPSQPSINGTPSSNPLDSKAIGQQDKDALPQTNNVDYESPEQARATEENTPDVSRVTPEVETHAEDIPAGDVIERTPADAPTENEFVKVPAVGEETKVEETNTAEQPLNEEGSNIEEPSSANAQEESPLDEPTTDHSVLEPNIEHQAAENGSTEKSEIHSNELEDQPREVKREPTETEHSQSQEPELEYKIANMEPILEVDSNGARPVPRAMPSSTRVPIETPSEDLDNESRVFEQSFVAEDNALEKESETPRQSIDEPTQQVDLHEDTHSSAGTTPVQETRPEQHHDDDGVTKELPDAEIDEYHENPETLPGENVPTLEASSTREEISKDEAPRRLDDENPVENETSDADANVDDEVKISPTAVERSPAETVNEQPEVTSSEGQDVRNEENDLQSMEKVHAMEEDASEEVEDHPKEQSAAAIDSQPTTEHGSIEESLPSEHSEENPRIEDVSEKEGESWGLEPESVSRDIEPSHQSNICSSPEEPAAVHEHVSEVMDNSHVNVHEEAPSTKTEAAIEHDAALPVAEVEAKPGAPEGTSVADVQSVSEEKTHSDHEGLELESENVSDGTHHLPEQPHSDSNFSGISPSMDASSEFAAEEASTKSTPQVPEENTATQETFSTPESAESHAADESALSPKLPPVQSDTSIAEDLSVAAHDIPSLQDETREAIEEAVPIHSSDVVPEESVTHEEDELHPRSQSEAEPEHEGIASSYTVPDAADHETHVGVESAAANFDESHNNEEKEFDELSDGHATNTALSETPPTSLEGSFPNIDDASLKEDHKSANGHEDVDQNPFKGHMDDSEVSYVEHQEAEIDDRSFEPGRETLPSVRVQEREIEEPNQTDDETSSQSMAPEPTSEQVGLSSNETPTETIPEHSIAPTPANEKHIEASSDASTVSDPRDEPIEERLDPSPESSPAQPQVSSSAEEEQTQPARPQTPNDQQPRVIDFPSTPSAQMIHQTEDHSLAESPVTVVNADDLFADDDEDDECEEQYHQDEHRHADSDPEYDGSGYGTAEAASHIEPIHHDVSGEDSHPSWPLPSGDTEKSDILDHYSHPELPSAHTGLFASLVDTIRSDLPAVEKIIHDSNEDPHEEEYSEQEDLSDIEADAHSEDEFEATPLDHIPEEEEDYHPSHDMESSLHIRTHTADTVPSFETYAHSDEESSPSTPIDEIAERAEDALQTERLIRSSWPVQPHDVDPQEDSQDLKPQASPMQTDFDPFSTQAYPAYITPKTSQANLKGEHTPESDFQSSPGESENGHQEPARSPRFPTLNTDLENRPYDSPPSATHSQTDADFQPPTPTRRPTATDRAPISTSRTPVSSPSIPSNSFFQKTRSLFESSSTSQPPTPPTTRPLSGIFNIRGSGSPSPPPKPASLKSSRPSSLYQVDNPAEELIVPRSLDAVPKPPSPGFVLPVERRPSDLERKRSSSSFLSDDNRRLSGDKEVRQRSSGSFLTRLVGSGGLEDSIHNPARAPLLQNQEDGGRENEY